MGDLHSSPPIDAFSSSSSSPFLSSEVSDTRNSLGFSPGEKEGKRGVEGEEEEEGRPRKWWVFIGRARDKRGARQQAAQKLLESFFPSLQNRLASVVVYPPVLSSSSEEGAPTTTGEGEFPEKEEGDGLGRNLARRGGGGGEESSGDVDGTKKEEEDGDAEEGDRSTVEGDDEDEEEEEKTEEELEMERAIEASLQNPEFFRSFVPALVEASFTLLATTPSNTLNNLCLVRKRSPGLISLEAFLRLSKRVTARVRACHYTCVYVHPHTYIPRVHTPSLSMPSPTITGLHTCIYVRIYVDLHMPV